MDSTQIMIVEDDCRLAMLVSDFLSGHGYEVCCESRGDTAAQRIVAECPDAVLLDINLPGLDGIEVCRTIRSDYPGIIIVLTARGDETDEVLCLGVGADDYMAKPLRPQALLARLRIHLNRNSDNNNPDSHSVKSPNLVAGCLTIDPTRRRVELRGKVVSLTTAEFDLLRVLAEQSGQPISRSDLYEKLFGTSYDGQDRSLDLRISRLRKKLGDESDDPRLIKSVRGVGYHLSEEP